MGTNHILWVLQPMQVLQMRSNATMKTRNGNMFPPGSRFMRALEMLQNGMDMGMYAGIQK